MKRIGAAQRAVEIDNCDNRIDPFTASLRSACPYVYRLRFAMPGSVSGEVQELLPKMGFGAVNSWLPGVQSCFVQ